MWPDAADEDAGSSAGLGTQCARAVEAEGRARVTLGAGGVKRSDPPVVGGESALDFRVAANRGTEQEAGGDDPSRPLRREIVGAEVDPGCAGREGNVEAIVDEDGNREERHQVAREGEQVAVRGLLESQLQRRDPAGHGVAGDRDRVARPEQEVVGHQQETEGGG